MFFLRMALRPEKRSLMFRPHTAFQQGSYIQHAHSHLGSQEREVLYYAARDFDEPSECRYGQPANLDNTRWDSGL